MWKLLTLATLNCNKSKLNLRGNLVEGNLQKNSEKKYILSSFGENTIDGLRKQGSNIIFFLYLL